MFSGLFRHSALQGRLFVVFFSLLVILNADLRVLGLPVAIDACNDRYAYKSLSVIE